MTRMSCGTSALVLLAALLVASNLSSSVSADDAIVVYPRLELNTIMTAKRYSRQRDLLIQALSAIMVDLPPEDIYSFYQIGGIHGEPAAPYNNTVNATSPFNFNTTAMVRWLGYCEHSSVLFPTWHRPYVLLLELSITKKAKQIAKTYTKHRSLYMKAAKELRWPFWDWAARSLVYGGKVPSILTDREATVIGPNGKRKTLANPFFAYVYQKDTAPQTPANSPLYNPNYPNYPFTVKKGQSSSRWPDADNVTNNADFIASMSTLNPSYQPPFAGIPESFPKMVMDLFAIRSWPCFSNRQQQLQLQNFGAGTSAFDNTSICIYQAIESVHNWVHLSIGGQARGNRQSGTMSNLQTAGFDPIFFLHHANVDRLFALWQAFRPNEYVEPGVSLYGSYMYDKGMPQNVTSPLWPFVQQSGPSAGKVYTSVDVADVMQLGYTYPDLVGNPSYKQLYANMVEKYGPVQKPFRWFYYVSCSTSWLNATALAVNASFMPTATSPWIPLNTSVVPILMGREGPDRNNELFVASSATEITELMRSYNLTTEVPPVDGNYAKGPSTIPLFVKNFESNCINGTSAIPEPYCTCIQKVIWAVNAPIDHPYASYSGFTDVPDTCIDCP